MHLRRNAEKPGQTAIKRHEKQKSPTSLEALKTALSTGGAFSLCRADTKKPDRFTGRVFSYN
jgi:hypothetical protein